MLASLQGKLLLGLAFGALQTQGNLLGRLGLFVEDGLGLTTVSPLFAVVTTLTLGEKGGLYAQRCQCCFVLYHNSTIWMEKIAPCQPCTG